MSMTLPFTLSYVHSIRVTEGTQYINAALVLSKVNSLMERREETQQERRVKVGRRDGGEIRRGKVGQGREERD